MSMGGSSSITSIFSTPKFGLMRNLPVPTNQQQTQQQQQIQQTPGTSSSNYNNNDEASSSSSPSPTSVASQQRKEERSIARSDVSTSLAFGERVLPSQQRYKKFESPFIWFCCC